MKEEEETELTFDDIKSWSADSLRDFLRQRNLKVSGRKEDLQALVVAASSMPEISAPRTPESTAELKSDSRSTVKAKMPKTGKFTLEERMAVLELIKPKVNIVDAFQSDAHASDNKKEAWEYITKEFIKDRADRQDLTSKEIRELWRRMKHRARMEVRQSIQEARVGNVRAVTETDSMGWLPDNTGHRVIDINDLGLEADTKYITDFVPLLEEEATVLETRNGILLHDYRGLTGKRRSSVPARPSDARKIHVRGDPGPSPVEVTPVDEIVDAELVEIVDKTSQISRTELPGEVSPNSEGVLIDPTEDSVCAIQISSVVSHSQPQQFTPDVSKGVHYDLRPKTSQMNSNNISQMMSGMNTNITSVTNASPTLNKMNSRVSSGLIAKTTTSINPRATSTSMTSGMNTNTTMGVNASRTTTMDSNRELTELSKQLLQQEHEAKMELIRLKQAAAKAKYETARAKRSAYDEKRMFYFEKRKMLHENGV